VNAAVSSDPGRIAPPALFEVGAAVEVMVGATGITTLKLVVAAVLVPPSPPYSTMK
jgi:hypothetical protein